MNIRHFNNLQKLILVLGCLALIYVVFFDPPKVIHGVNGVVVNANEYCKDIRNKLDCEIAVTNIGLLSIYLLVISIITTVLVFIATNKRGSP